MTIIAQVALTLMLYNIGPRSHTSIILVESFYLLYYIVDGREIDMVRIIANKIKEIEESGTKPRGKSNFPFAFPGLIMWLNKKAKIYIPNQVHEVISGVVAERYISRYCNSKPVHNREENEATLGSGLGFEEWMRTTTTDIWNQNTSNHRAISYVQ